LGIESNEHPRAEGRGIRSGPIFPELRPILDESFAIFGDKSEYVVAAPQYRAAANTAMGWKNSNLRTEMMRLLRRAGVSGWLAVATCRRSHLSPDGGGFTHAPPPLGSGWLRVAADGYGKRAKGKRLLLPTPLSR
jgi:hypothetical protein